MPPPKVEPITVVAHPPERRRRAGTVPAQAGACCCTCCCCCLHAIGGIIGAVAGSVVRVEPTPKAPDPSFPFPFRRDEEDPEFPFLPVLLYWALFLLLTGLTWLGLTLSGPRVAPGDMVGWGVVLVIVLPAVQLGASLLSLLLVSVLPTTAVPDRPGARKRVLRILIWSLVGTLTGGGLLFLLCFPFFLK
jgi:hypothetical protein